MHYHIIIIMILPIMLQPSCKYNCRNSSSWWVLFKLQKYSSNCRKYFVKFYVKIRDYEVNMWNPAIFFGNSVLVFFYKKNQNYKCDIISFQVSVRDYEWSNSPHVHYECPAAHNVLNCIVIFLRSYMYILHCKKDVLNS